MEAIEDYLSSHPTLRKVAGGIVVVTAGIMVHKWLKRRQAFNTLNEKKTYPCDTVILHQIDRGPYAPSLVPFAVKLETFLRMAKIPYQNDHSMKPSIKNKCPWITYNGEDVADSTFCIEYLNKVFHLDFNDWLTPEQRAVGVAIQRLVEEDLYWAMATTRWVTEVNEDFVEMLSRSSPLGKILATMFMKYVLFPKVREAVYFQGMGRHSRDGIRHIVRTDLTALSDYLGTKQFMMGEQPCAVDCAVFGQLSQFYWQLPSSLATIFKEEYPSLVSYCERMKDTFWPDWLQCTTQGGTTKATC